MQDLLGDQRFFKLEFEKVIMRGNSKDATKRDRDLSSARSKHLRERCAPYFLRREKKDVLKESRSPTFPLSSPLKSITNQP